MRITARIASSAERWAVEFPRIDEDICFPVNAKGNKMASPIGCLQQLKSDMITHSSSDTAFLRAIVCQWIRKINDWKDANDVQRTAPGVSHTLTRIHRKQDQGKVSYARADWYTVAPGDQLKVRITHCNRNDAVQVTEWDKVFAAIMAEAASIVSEELVDAHHKPLVLSEETTALLDWLYDWRADRRADDEAEKLREHCERRNGNICSPAKFDCPHYANGNCALKQ